MILSDASIRSQLAGDYITVEPTPTESQIQPSSLDLRLGAEYYDVYVDEHASAEETIVIRPGSFYLCHTQETIGLPTGISAMITGRSSFGRDGIIVHATAGWVDAGYRGQITLEVYNLNNRAIELPVGERVCQAVFFPLDLPAEVPYGEQPGSKYQDQEGAVPSRRASKQM